jgi:hypothetical protein
MKTRLTFIAWSLVALAIIAWLLVIYGANMIRASATDSANAARSARTQSSQLELNARIHSIASSTAQGRDTLETILSTDVVSIVDTIDAVGSVTGVSARVTDAAPGTVQQIKDGPALHSVTFSIEGSGTFAQIMRAVTLYEQLPLLSTVDYVEISHNGGEDQKVSPWSFKLHIRVMTSAQVTI